VKILIVDDEPKARSLLRALVSTHCPVVTEIEEAEDLPEAIKMIKAQKPKIVFLDIEMPQYSGLQLLDFFNPSEIDFEIIFTTAYSEYAIKAFQLNAISYLLKPLDIELLKSAVEKAIVSIDKNQITQKLVELKESFTASKFTKIGLPVADGVTFVEFDNIVMFQADGMYTKVYTLDEKELLISKPLKFIAEVFKSNLDFFRSHRSFIIHLKYISQYVKSDGNYIIMDTGVNASLSKEKRDDFIEMINQ